jgi:predicted nuclease of predicted toxin-antitoxin system
MKLIVDAQLPVKLCEILNQIGLGSIHVDELPQGDETPDVEITQFADRENLTVVTKDFDFYHSYMALGRPKKLFLVTTGNLKNRQLFDLFRNNSLIIKNALERSDFIELSNEGITERGSKKE